MVEQKLLRDFSNKKTLDGSICSDGEVLIPYRVDEAMLKSDSIIKENLETWKFCGKKVLVGFVPIKEENAEMMMKLFWRDVNEYLEKHRKKRCYVPNGKGGFMRCPKENNCTECLEHYKCDSKLFRTLYSSLDQMMKGFEDDGREGNAIDPTGTTESMDKAIVLAMLNHILDELSVMDKRYPQIFYLHYEGYKKSEILKTVDLGVAKSQGYALIDKVLRVVQKIWRDEF